jgi:hypothetical protein
MNNSNFSNKNYKLPNGFGKPPKRDFFGFDKADFP